MSFLARIDHDIGRQVVEGRAIKAVAVLAAVIGVTATRLHSQQLRWAFVEFMITDRRHVEAEQVHGFDGGLVVKQRGEQWGRPDHVTSSHHDGIRVCGAMLCDVAR